VGTHVEVEHLRASSLGEIVTAEAVFIRREGRVLDFALTAMDSSGIIGQGSHKRFIIEVEAFMDKLRNRGS
jgi:predicted thioesterase